MIAHEETYAHPTIVISSGGMGTAANIVCKAAVKAQLGSTDPSQPSWVESLTVDFPNASDSVSPVAVEKYGKDALVPLSQEETVPLEVEPLIALVHSKDPDPRYKPLWDVCKPEILVRSRSSQAGQKPAIGRVCFVFRADLFAQRLSQVLQRQARNGEVPHALRRQGFREDQIAPKVRIVMLTGAEGGTGSGVFMPAAIIATSVARDLGIEIEMEAWLAFRYRSASDQEATLRLALGAQFSHDVEIAQTPGLQFAITTLSGVIHRANGELFRRCIPFDGNGRLYGNAGGLALAMGEAIAFRSMKKIARDIDTGHAQNILSRTRP